MSRQKKPFHRCAPAGASRRRIANLSRGVPVLKFLLPSADSLHSTSSPLPARPLLAALAACAVMLMTHVAVPLQAQTTWDTTGNSVWYAPSGINVGIGTPNPTTLLEVNANNAEPGSPPSNTFVHFVGASGARILTDAFGGFAGFTGRRANGTPLSPSPVLSGQTLFSFNGFGYGSSGYSSASRGGFEVDTSQDWTDTAQGTYLGVLHDCQQFGFER